MAKKKKKKRTANRIKAKIRRISVAQAGYKIRYRDARGRFSSKARARSFHVYDQANKKFFSSEFPPGKRRSNKIKDRFASKLIRAQALPSLHEARRTEQKKRAEFAKASAKKRTRKPRAEKQKKPVRRALKITDSLERSVFSDEEHENGEILIRNRDIDFSKSLAITLENKANVIELLRGIFKSEFHRFWRENLKDTERKFLVRVKTIHFSKAFGGVLQGIGIKRRVINTDFMFNDAVKSLMEQFDTKYKNYLSDAHVTAIYVRGFSFEVVKGHVVK